LLVHHFLEQSAVRYPGKIAVIHDAVSASYGEVNGLANRLARFLIGMGVRKGDRVVLMFENSLEYVVGYYGTLKAGAVSVPLNTDLKSDGLKHLLGEIEPAFVIASNRFEKLMCDNTSDLPTIKGILLKAPKLKWSSIPFPIYVWGEIIEKGEGTKDPGISMSGDDLAGIIYTSGSTGRPKGVMLSHQNIVSNTRSICQYLNLTRDDVQMVVLPFFYVMGKSLLNTHMAAGGTVVINNKFAFPAAVLNEMVKEGVTGFSGVPPRMRTSFTGLPWQATGTSWRRFDTAARQAGTCRGSSRKDYDRYYRITRPYTSCTAPRKPPRDYLTWNLSDTRTRWTR